MSERKYVVKKSLGGSQTYRVWEDYTVGDWVLGRYVGNHVCQYKKENPKIEVLDAGFDDLDFSDSIIGKTLVLNAAGSLSAQIDKVEVNPQGRDVTNITMRKHLARQAFT